MLEDALGEAKLKLLRLYTLLEQETDEEHPITRAELAQAMVNMGYGAQLRVVTDDIDLMNQNGFQIDGSFDGHERCFFIKDRLFTKPELRILLDAIQAAGFLSPAKTQQLSEKLVKLAAAPTAKELLAERTAFTAAKSLTESVLYSVNTLNKAIRAGKQVSFCYFDLNSNAKRVYRKEGERYRVEPLALVYQDNNFYCITWNGKYKNYCNYRVDRMEKVRPEQEPISAGAKAAQKATPPAVYTRQSFHMYNGPLTEVSFAVRTDAFNRFFDRFGTDVTLTPLTGDLYGATLPVQLSPEFYAWIFRFDGDIQIIGPASVKKEYTAMLGRAARLHREKTQKKNPEPEQDD